MDLAAFASDAPADDELLGAANGTTSLRGLTARLGDPTAVPQAAPQATPAADDVVLHEWLSQFDAPVATPELANDLPGWLTDLGADMTTSPESTPGATPDEPTGLEPVDETAGWLNEFSPENLRSDLDGVVAGTGSEWLGHATAAPDPAASAVDAGLPDWLIDAAPEATAGVAAAMAGTTTRPRCRARRTNSTG